MAIIDEGASSPNVTRIITCSNCGCTFSATSSDMWIEHWNYYFEYKYDPYNDSTHRHQGEMLFVKCEKCRHKIRLSAGGIPQVFLNRVRRIDVSNERLEIDKASKKQRNREKGFWRRIGF